jgi:hypothetical protein
MYFACMNTIIYHGCCLRRKGWESWVYLFTKNTGVIIVCMTFHYSISKSNIDTLYLIKKNPALSPISYSRCIYFYFQHKDIALVNIFHCMVIVIKFIKWLLLKDNCVRINLASRAFSHPLVYLLSRVFLTNEIIFILFQVNQ